MHYGCRVIKYRVNTNGSVEFSLNEWTSYSDIEKKVSENEYIKIENLYLCCVMDVCNQLCINGLKINELDLYDSSITYKEGQFLEKEQYIEVARDVLREKYWCKLVSDSCEFHFGYDFYMYVISNIDIFEFLENKYSNFSIQRFMSPYYNNQVE